MAIYNNRGIVPAEFRENQHLNSLAIEIKNYSSKRDYCRVFCIASLVTVLMTTILFGDTTSYLFGLTVLGIHTLVYMEYRVACLTSHFDKEIVDERIKNFVHIK
ncbi:MAG: hypothetical protein VX777_10400 [Chlamydiota bacterium]|nr:hypothetical protein [Chlamydiota bacterium]